jgi:hypothetical protein
VREAKGCHMPHGMRVVGSRAVSWRDYWGGPFTPVTCVPYLRVGAVPLRHSTTHSTPSWSYLSCCEKENFKLI